MTTENKEAVRSRPRNISNYKNHIISLRFIFNQKTSIYLTLIQCIPVFSPNVCSLSQKKNRILRWVISIAGRTSLRSFKIRSGFCSSLINIVVFADVKFMGKQIQNSNSGKQNDIITVSYTHLTLPTKRIV